MLGTTILATEVSLIFHHCLKVRSSHPVAFVTNRNCPVSLCQAYIYQHHLFICATESETDSISLSNVMHAGSKCSYVPKLSHFGLSSPFICSVKYNEVGQSQYKLFSPQCFSRAEFSRGHDVDHRAVLSWHCLVHLASMNCLVDALSADVGRRGIAKIHLPVQLSLLPIHS